MPFKKCPVCGGELIEKEVEKLLRGGVHTAVLRVHEKNKAGILHLVNDKGLGQMEWVGEQVSGRVSWKKGGNAGSIAR